MVHGKYSAATKQLEEYILARFYASLLIQNNILKYSN